MTQHLNLTGRIDGHLKYDRPIPARFRLGEREVSPEILLKIGMLLESIRMGYHESIVNSQLRDLKEIGADSDLTETLLKTHLKVDITIRNGAGNVTICERIMRFIRESALKGDEVSTRGKDEVISAGAYIWMTAPRRFTNQDTRFLWHTRTPHPEGATPQDKEEDMQIFRPFFEGAQEPLRSKFLHAIDEDDQGCHEITTTGAVLIRAGLAEPWPFA